MAKSKNKIKPSKAKTKLSDSALSDGHGSNAQKSLKDEKLAPINIDQYKVPHENEEHWELRRAFLEKNQSVLSEEELLCFAQLFMNVHLLHCRYPPDTMERLAVLSEGITKEYDRARAFKLKRTFVLASDAAASKIRRELPVSSTTCDSVETGNKGCPPEVDDAGANDDLLKKVIIHNSLKETMEAFNRLKTRVKMEFIVQRSHDDMFETMVKFGDRTIGYACETSRPKANRAAADMALDFLSSSCYETARQGTTTPGEEIISKTSSKEDYTKIDPNNVGFKMLAKLGWTGGSLGRRGEGIVDPVTVNDNEGRKGLGNSTGLGKKDLQMIKEKLKALQAGKLQQNHVVFSKEYTKEERAAIHMLARRMKLKSQSYGNEKKGGRHIRVSLKNSKKCLETEQDSCFI